MTSPISLYCYRFLDEKLNSVCTYFNFFYCIFYIKLILIIVFTFLFFYVKLFLSTRLNCLDLIMLLLTYEYACMCACLKIHRRIAMKYRYVSKPVPIFLPAGSRRGSKAAFMLVRRGPSASKLPSPKHRREAPSEVEFLTLVRARDGFPLCPREDIGRRRARSQRGASEGTRSG